MSILPVVVVVHRKVREKREVWGGRFLCVKDEEGGRG